MDWLPSDIRQGVNGVDDLLLEVVVDGLLVGVVGLTLGLLLETSRVSSGNFDGV